MLLQLASLVLAPQVLRCPPLQRPGSLQQVRASRLPRMLQRRARVLYGQPPTEVQTEV